MNDELIVLFSGLLLIVWQDGHPVCSVRELCTTPSWTKLIVEKWTVNTRKWKWLLRLSCISLQWSRR